MGRSVIRFEGRSLVTPIMASLIKDLGGIGTSLVGNTADMKVRGNGLSLDMQLKLVNLCHIVNCKE